MTIKDRIYNQFFSSFLKRNVNYAMTTDIQAVSKLFMAPHLNGLFKKIDCEYDEMEKMKLIPLDRGRSAIGSGLHFPSTDHACIVLKCLILK